MGPVRFGMPDDYVHTTAGKQGVKRPNGGVAFHPLWRL